MSKKKVYPKLKAKVSADEPDVFEDVEVDEEPVAEEVPVEEIRARNLAAGNELTGVGDDTRRLDVTEAPDPEKNEKGERRKVVEFSGEPVDVKVGDVFTSVANQGGGFVVTEENLKNLILRRKANIPEEAAPVPEEPAVVNE